MNHPAVDYVLAAVGAGAYVGGYELWGPFVPEARSILLQTLAALAGAAFGVAVTVVAIVASLAPRPRVAALVSSVSGHLWRIILGSLAAMGLAAAAFAVFIALATPDRKWIWPATAGLLVLLIARSGRMLWVLGKLFLAASADPGETPSATALNPIRGVPDPSRYPSPRARGTAESG